MPTVEEMKMARDTEATKDVPVAGGDVELLTRMCIQLMNEGGGLDVIAQALNESQDPGQVVGQFIAQLMGQLGEQARGEVNIDMRAFLANDGVLEHVLDYIEGKLGLPPEFSDQVYNEVVEVIKAAASDPQPPSQGGPPPQQQAQPQQPMPPQGGGGIQGAY